MVSVPLVVLTIVLVQALFVALMWSIMERRRLTRSVRNGRDECEQLQHSLNVLQLQLEVFTSRSSATVAPTPTAPPAPPIKPPTAEEIETVIRDLERVRQELEERRDQR